MVKTAIHLEVYAALDTTLLRSYDLTSPTHTPIVVEDNAQVLEDSIAAWQESPATQPALPEEIRLRYWPDGTAVEPPDTDSLPSTLIYPPSPKPSRKMADDAASSATANPLKRAHVGPVPGEEDVVIDVAEPAEQLGANSSDESEMELTKEEIRAQKIMDRQLKGPHKKTESIFVEKLVPMTKAIDTMGKKVIEVDKKVDKVEAKVDGALWRINVLEQAQLHAASSPPGSSLGSAGSGDFDPRYVLIKLRPFNSQTACPSTDGAK